MIIPKQWPDCDRKTECRAACMGMNSTNAFMAAYGNLVDRDGNICKPPPPKTYCAFKCITCGQDWSEET